MVSVSGEESAARVLITLAEKEVAIAGSKSEHMLSGGGGGGGADGRGDGGKATFFEGNGIVEIGCWGGLGKSGDLMRAEEKEEVEDTVDIEGGEDAVDNGIVLGERGADGMGKVPDETFVGEEVQDAVKGDEGAMVVREGRKACCAVGDEGIYEAGGAVTEDGEAESDRLMGDDGEENAAGALSEVVGEGVVVEASEDEVV
uniref:Uncharacterized protein n=1 Tax=Parascaris equorum TaxID=6256 RepID=A0A914S5U4_PAREQ